MHRRSFLQSSASVLGLAGTSFIDRVGLMADELRKQDRACILVWLAGAPSQFETWDPKPGTKTGGPTKSIKTSVPGIEIASHWPRIAQSMKEFAVLRTIVGKEAAHDRGTYHLHTGRRLTGAVRFPHFGSVVSSKLGSEEAELPNFVSIGKTLSSGFLGVELAPFIVDQPGDLPQNVKALTADARLQRRLRMLREQEQGFASAGAKQLVDERAALYEKAQRLMRTDQLKAFELTGESEKTTQRYGSSQLGKGLLVARRLIDSGVPFVEVRRNGWDMHNDLFNKIKPASADVDRSLTALIEDLKQRGRLERTLVICMGEFGRTPKLNQREPSPGRDHWAKNFNALIAGAGLSTGQVIGSTNRTGEEIANRPIAVEDLFQTFCRVLGIDANEELYTPEGRPLAIVDGGQTIKELFA